jgi:hypothetical protein
MGWRLWGRLGSNQRLPTTNLAPPSGFGESRGLWEPRTSQLITSVVAKELVAPIPFCLVPCPGHQAARQRSPQYELIDVCRDRVDASFSSWTRVGHASTKTDEKRRKRCRAVKGPLSRTNAIIGKSRQTTKTRLDRTLNP